jgi:uncharacterized membrane protein YkvA (DUF1232 family)
MEHGNDRQAQGLGQGAQARRGRVWIAARDRRTPLSARIFSALVAAYALSPIDLIPDVIPVLGLLDDLLLVPLGLLLAIRLIPGALLAEFRHRAETVARPRQAAAPLWSSSC